MTGKDVSPADTGLGGYRLEHRTVGSLRGQFRVPSYQRGYRWTKDDVKRLLGDVWDSRGVSYSLQPIVVKLLRPDANERQQQWELIDGQQRLTTLYLLLQYMQRNTQCGLGAPYELQYETHVGSAQYLKNPVEEEHESDIDFFHIYQAASVIDAWFRERGDEYDRNAAANDLHNHLFKSVRIIWYEAPPDASGPAFFTRLNVGRIPLTDAELVKAVLLSKVRAGATDDRAQEIAAQWDGIERDLHRQEIWAFVSGLSAESQDEQYPTRISLLLNTLAKLPAENPSRYYTFDVLRGKIESDPLAFWSGVVALHAQILGWFERPQIHNKIGFLVASAANSAPEFQKITLVANKITKSQFDDFLTNRIRKLIGISADGLTDLSYEEKRTGSPKLLQLLLLMNVQTASNTGQRFPFFRHVGQQWSLEHIHAQNAQTLNKAAQWVAWLRVHARALDAVNADDSATAEVAEIKSEIEAALTDLQDSKPRFSGQSFAALSERVLKKLNRDDTPDHTIRNMALLSCSQNSELNNAVYEVKRQRILELDRSGAYVPACTRNVFLKYYADADEQQPHFWSEQDKDAYLKAVLNLLSPYLQKDKQVHA